jgi:hypothetical protein
MSVTVINESTATYVTLAFEVDEVPSTLEYRLDCATNDQELVDWTEVNPSTSVRITVHSASNAIIDDENEYERKILTYRATYLETDIVYGEAEYWVKNLSYV